MTGVCRVCRRSHSVRLDGTLARHSRKKGVRCPGAERFPEGWTPRVFEAGSPRPRPAQRVTRVQPLGEDGQPDGPVYEFAADALYKRRQWFVRFDEDTSGFVSWADVVRGRRALDVSPWIREAMR